ncbi:hypothetical protein WN48_04067 [Eufriesea mexicana]|uniref:Uncharacterized protein n=1 Tax=Eufriesea mexicana TaxID=516756 RepID=A0A310SP37_9HYME|nr:hypothetical protein WN48_04067 [Eufriesea mexicana]
MTLKGAIKTWKLNYGKIKQQQQPNHMVYEHRIMQPQKKYNMVSATALTDEKYVTKFTEYLKKFITCITNYTALSCSIDINDEANDGT